MNRRLRLLLFAAALPAAYGVVTTAAAASSAGAAAMPVLQALRRVEEDAVKMSSFEQDDNVVAYPQRRVLQSGGYINYRGLAASKDACIGPCPARGQPYTGHGCQQIHQCRQ